MIPGPYSVCRFELVDDTGDALAYFTLSYGYDTVAQAREAMPELAAELDLPVDEMCVVRVYADGEEE